MNDKPCIIQVAYHAWHSNRRRRLNCGMSGGLKSCDMPPNSRFKAYYRIQSTSKKCQAHKPTKRALWNFQYQFRSNARQPLKKAFDGQQEECSPRSANAMVKVYTHWILSCVLNRLGYGWANLHQTFRGCRGKVWDRPREDFFWSSIV